MRGPSDWARVTPGLSETIIMVFHFDRTIGHPNSGDKSRSQHPRKVRLAIRLGKQQHTGIKMAVVDNDFIRIAGGEQYFQRRPALQRGVGESASRRPFIEPGMIISTASRPTFVTMANAPLSGGTCGSYHNFRFSERNIFRPGLEIPISLIPLKKLAFRRRRFRAVEARTSAMNRCEWIKLICPTSGKSPRPDPFVRDDHGSLRRTGRHVFQAMRGKLPGLRDGSRLSRRAPPVS